MDVISFFFVYMEYLSFYLKIILCVIIIFETRDQLISIEINLFMIIDATKILFFWLSDIYLLFYLKII